MIDKKNEIIEARNKASDRLMQDHLAAAQGMRIATEKQIEEMFRDIEEQTRLLYKIAEDKIAELDND